MRTRKFTFEIYWPLHHKSRLLFDTPGLPDFIWFFSVQNKQQILSNSSDGSFICFYVLLMSIKTFNFVRIHMYTCVVTEFVKIWILKLRFNSDGITERKVPKKQIWLCRYARSGWYFKVGCMNECKRGDFTFQHANYWIMQSDSRKKLHYYF